ncbi:SPOR domain-containing protein [Thalassospira sp. MA62]|nr:SPOR domain-containing protein [Thalassospira sp. MA62]
MKISSVTSVSYLSAKRGILTVAALLPFLSGCGAIDDTGTWFTRDATPTADEQAAVQDASVDSRLACQIFFRDTAQDSASAPVEQSDEIALDRNPQDNLLHAIAYDIDGNYASARKLYVWLTASPPDAVIDIDCGQGISLRGSVSSLAQRRLAALDQAAPQYARSAEIETVIAAATVAPGPDLPNPPQVERDRRFYQQGGVVIAPPEDSTTPLERMNLPVSTNTATLTKVEPRAQTSNSTVPHSAPTTQETPVVERLAPTATPEPTSAGSAAPVGTDAPKPTVEPIPIDKPTIAGAEETTDHTGNIVASNSRPVEDGQLDIVDPAPAVTRSNANMIEVPMTNDSGTPAPTVATGTTSPPTAPANNPVSVASAPAQTAPGPYYAVQLAAYRSRERAEAAWRTFQTRSGDVLNGQPHEISTITIDGQGLFFRLLTGRYQTNADATNACRTLKNNGTDCLIRQMTP